MRLIQLLVTVVSSFSPAQALAPAPTPPAAIVSPAPAGKPFHSFATPWGVIQVDDDVCDVITRDDGGPLFLYVAPDGQFAVSEANCADAVRTWMFSRTVKLPKA